MANNVFTGTIDNDSTKAGNWGRGEGNLLLAFKKY